MDLFDVFDLSLGKPNNAFSKTSISKNEYKTLSSIQDFIYCTADSHSQHQFETFITSVLLRQLFILEFSFNFVI